MSGVQEREGFPSLFLLAQGKDIQQEPAGDATIITSPFFHIRIPAGLQGPPCGQLRADSRLGEIQIGEEI